MKMKKREVSLDLKKLRYLYWRDFLSDEDRLKYLHDEKGFEGELKFDGMLESIPDSSVLILDDLLLEQNQSTFQLDSTLIFQNRLHFFEVKNYEGDYFILNDQWHSFYGKEIKNPIHQTQRSAMLLKQLISSYGREYHIPIESHVVFVHPEFCLFQANKDSPIILPGQIPRLITKLSQTSSQLQPIQYNLANKLKKSHKNEYPISKVPPYKFSAIKKGIHCELCHHMGFELQVNTSRKLVCDYCGHVEAVDLAVMRMVEEFRILFPNQKITVAVIKEWCGGMVYSRIKRILDENLNLVKKGRYSYYE